MEMYHFITTWFFRAPIEKVWNEVIDVEAYPTWWPGIRRVIIQGPESRIQVGSIVDYKLKGSLPNTLQFSTKVTSLQPPSIVELESLGDLVGEGKGILESQSDGTIVTFYWEVGMSNPFLNLIGKLSFVKTVLEKSHNDAMAKGYQALKTRLAK
jgi:hypothetical protein